MNGTGVSARPSSSSLQYKQDTDEPQTTTDVKIIALDPPLFVAGEAETEFVEVEWAKDAAAKFAALSERIFRLHVLIGKEKVPIYLMEGGRGAYFRATGIAAGTYNLNGSAFTVQHPVHKGSSKSRAKNRKHAKNISYSSHKKKPKSAAMLSRQRQAQAAASQYSRQMMHRPGPYPSHP